MKRAASSFVCFQFKSYVLFDRPQGGRVYAQNTHINTFINEKIYTARRTVAIYAFRYKAAQLLSVSAVCAGFRGCDSNIDCG